MKSFKFIAAFALVAVVSAFGLTGSVQAAQECKVSNAVDGLSLTDLTNKGITISGNTITAKVIVSGDANCVKSASIATWKWYTPNGLPIKEQELYKTATGTFGPGAHTLSVEVPACMWQADLVQGTRPTAADGTADYNHEKGDFMLDVAYGGKGVCTKDTPVVPVNTDVTKLTTLPSTGAASILVPTALLSLATGFGYSLITRKKLVK